jgi:hypothetical protein
VCATQGMRRHIKPLGIANRLAALKQKCFSSGHGQPDAAVLVVQLSATHHRRPRPVFRPDHLFGCVVFEPRLYLN